MTSGQAAVAESGGSDHGVGGGADRGARRLLIAASVLAVVAHLFGLYRVTGPPTVSWFANSDKLEHAIGFGLPVLLILLALDRYGRSSAGWQWLVVGIFAAHAVVSELIQHWFYLHRSGDPRDAVADWVGVLLGWLGYRLIRSRSRRR